MVIFQPLASHKFILKHLNAQAQITHAGHDAFTSRKTQQQAQPNRLRFTGKTEDALELSASPTHSTVAKKAAAHYVDQLLEECDQQPAVERMTLRDFLIKAHLEPQRYLPTASSYVLDAFQHYDGPSGPEKIRAYGESYPQYKLMSAPWNGHLSHPPRLYGQEPTVHRIREIIRTFKQQSNVDRGIVLFGPHGSGKSIIPKTLMAGLAHFSQQDEGALWTYSFVFPKPEITREKGIQASEPKIGESQTGEFNTKTPVLRIETEKKQLLDADKVVAQLMANLNLNPIFLLAPKQRLEFLKDLKLKGKVPSDFNMDYYLKSNLDSHSQAILNQLHQFYSDHPQRFQKALDHIQVERYTLSAQDFRGLVEVPASKNPDALLRETPGKSALANAPERLRSMTQRTLEGLMPRAHRGMFYLDDYGRDGRSYDHLLMPLETNEVILQEMNGGPAISKELLDFIPMLSVNPEILEKKRAEGNFEALEQRMLFVPVPFERRYQMEMQILAPIIQQAKAQGKTITPHTLEAFAQWVTLTRLFPVDKTHKTYQDIASHNPAFASGLGKLTPLGKALLYQGEKADNLTHAEYDALDAHQKLIANEHNHSLGEIEFSLYEGGVGLSNRVAANLLKQLIARSGEAPITFLDGFEWIARFIEQKPQYEQKRAELLKTKAREIAFPSGQALLREVEDHTRNIWMRQLRGALGIYQDPAAYVHRIQQYADHIEAQRDGRMVAEAYRIDGDSAPNSALITQFESAMHGGKKLNPAEQITYRTLFSTRAIDWDRHQSESENVQAIYQPEMERLKTADEILNQKTLTRFKEKLKTGTTHPSKPSQPFHPSHAERFTRALQQLKEEGYPPEILPKLLDWALENRYISDQLSAQIKEK